MNDTEKVQYSDIYIWLLSPTESCCKSIFKSPRYMRGAAEERLSIINTYQWGITGHSIPGIPGKQWGLVKFPLVKYIITTYK